MLQVEKHKTLLGPCIHKTACTIIKRKKGLVDSKTPNFYLGMNTFEFGHYTVTQSLHKAHIFMK